MPEAGSDGDYTDGSEFMAGADEPDSDVDFDFDVLAEEEMDDDAALRAPTLAASRRARAREAPQEAAPAAAEAQPAEQQHRYSTRQALSMRCSMTRSERLPAVQVFMARVGRTTASDGHCWRQRRPTYV